MAYATVEDLKLRFGEDVIELLDRDDDDQDDAGLADAVLAEASGEIDTILAARYAVPIPGPVPFLVSVCSDLARHRLYDDVVPEAVEYRRKEAITHLRAIAKGQGELINDQGDLVPDKTATGKGGGGAVSVKARDRIFSDDELKGYMGP